MTALLSYFFIALGRIELKNVSVSDIWNLVSMKDCFLRHWLQMTSFFFPIVTIRGYQFQWNYLKNEKCFLHFFLRFWNLHQILSIWQNLRQLLNNLEHYRPLYLPYFRNYRLPKTSLDQCPKSRITEHPSTVILLKVPKHLWNLRQRTFIIFFHHSGENWVRKCLC